MHNNTEKRSCIKESTPLSFQEECTREISMFLETHKLTLEELFAAHELALGVPEQDLEMKSKPQEKVFELAKRLGELYEEGFSPTRVAAWCAGGREIDNTSLPFQEECEFEILMFIKTHQLTPEELFAAHELALGVPEQDLEMKSKPQEKVFELAKRLGELYEEGFSLTRVAQICATGRNMRKMPAKALAEIENLSIVESEKQLLTDLIKNVRPGTLYVFLATQDKPIEMLVMDKHFCQHPMKGEIFAMMFLSALHKVKEKKISFTFDAHSSF